MNLFRNFVGHLDPNLSEKPLPSYREVPREKVLP